MNIPLELFYSRLGTIAIILVLGFILGKAKLIDTKANNGLHAGLTFRGIPKRI